MEYETCPQCLDDHWFREEGINKHKREIHEEAVREANQQAKTKASADFKTKCSFGWNKLWMIHFTELYESLVSQKREVLISKYQTACYKKSYGDKEKDICGYHAECRW
jgi:hypothetical protein